MANMYMNDSYSAVRQADGKVLGRVRAVVKSATPQAGVKDFRFFVDPVSPLPRGFEDGEKFGFTGFMSRIGFDTIHSPMRSRRWQIWSPFSGIASCRLHRQSAITGTLCWMIW